MQEGDRRGLFRRRDGRGGESPGAEAGEESATVYAHDQ
jgi:hypothetical protein